MQPVANESVMLRNERYKRGSATSEWQQIGQKRGRFVGAWWRRLGR